MKRVQVDFNMIERGSFVAVVSIGADIKVGDLFTAFDVEGHEMLARCVDVESGCFSTRLLFDESHSA